MFQSLPIGSRVGSEVVTAIELLYCVREEYYWGGNSNRIIVLCDGRVLL